jgi:lysophospholipid acyltransferase (LPLAT)-like uncharacterized protein
MIPKPFAKITVAFGDPIYVPDEADREECLKIRESVDRKMAALEQECVKQSARE